MGANLIGGLLFSSIGLVAFAYGKKTSALKPMLIGASLIGYSYFVANTVLLYIIGAALTAALFIFRD